MPSSRAMRGNDRSLTIQHMDYGDDILGWKRQCAEQLLKHLAANFL